MKTRTLLTIIVALLIISCSKQEKATIKGKMQNAPEGELVYLKEIRTNSDHMIDSSDLKRSGKFKFEFNLKDPGFYQLVFSSGQSLSFIIFPDEKIELSAVMNDFYSTKKIIGSPNSIRLNELHDSLRTTTILLDELRAEYFDKKSLLNENQKDSIANEYLRIRDAYKRYSSGFILEDLKSLANIGALYQELTPNEYVFNNARDIQFFKLVSDTLSKYYPNVRLVVTLKDNYESLYTEYHKRRLMQSTDYETYDVPELSLPDVKGQFRQLSNLKGRIVLLSFWQINQPESVENVIALKSIYSKFNKHGFEIYQVAFDKSLSRWKKAVAFEEIPWISVIDTSFPGSKTQVFYNVTELPMNYLIDKEQKTILAKNISPDFLDKNLPQLLTQK